MSVPTAELTAPAAATPAAARPAGLLQGMGARRFYLALVGVALLVGAVSLAIPSTPSYDPWAWLVWGREIVHLNLHTTGGPTWKPLPVIFTTVFALFGKVAPDLWLVVARAGAVMACVMVFKVAARLTRGVARRAVGCEPRSLLAPAILAGLIAAVSLGLSDGFLSDNALGYSEGLLTAAVLIAVDLHLDGRHRAAFAVGFAAALDRPEIWLFWGPYGLWLWWRDPGARKLVAALFVAIPVLWFLPEYWGSGHFLRGVNRAHHPRSNSPAFAKCPFCTELVDHAWPAVLLRVKIAAVFAVGVCAWLTWRVLRVRRPLRLAGLRLAGDGERARVAVISAGLLGLAWWVLIALLTQAGFSGNNRYLVLGAALVEIAGGVGFGWAAVALTRVIRERVPPAATRGSWPGVALLAAVFLFVPNWVGANLINIPRTHRALVYQAHLREDASRAVAELGGPSRILRCGTVMTEGFQVPMLAWTLGVHTLRVQASPLSVSSPGPPPDVIFQTRAQRKAHLLPVVRAWTGVSYKLVAHVRTFRVFANCANRVTL